MVVHFQFTVYHFLGALKILQEELVATKVPPESSEAYRLSLAYSLFYKVRTYTTHIHTLIEHSYCFLLYL